MSEVIKVRIKPGVEVLLHHGRKFIWPEDDLTIFVGKIEHGGWRCLHPDKPGAIYVGSIDGCQIVEITGEAP